MNLSDAQLDEIIALFKTSSGQQMVLKPGQKRIFRAIVTKKDPRNVITTYTRYGKSLVVALGVIVRATMFPETWAIVAPTKDKAGIIMRYVLQHVFDHQVFYSQLETDISLERLKRDRRRDNITFRRGGRIFTLSAEVRNSKRIGEAILGEGAGNVIEDESPLIPDQTHSFILRMLGDSADSFLIQIGNAFNDNHFKRAFTDPLYKKHIVNCYQGLKESALLPYAEGKLTQEFLDEMKDKPFFDILYECRFPKGVLTDERGYTILITQHGIEEVYNREPVEPEGTPKLGVDIGRGGDYSVYVLRYNNYAKVLEKNLNEDLMFQVGRIQHYMEEYGIESTADVFVDDIGVGGGVTDRCRELDIPITAIAAGGVPRDDKKFANIKAEGYWEATKWLKDPTTRFERNADFKEQMSEIKYIEDSSRRLKIEPKLDLKKRKGWSPDVAEAFMLTFCPQETVPEVAFI